MVGAVRAAREVCCLLRVRDGRCILFMQMDSSKSLDNRASALLTHFAEREPPTFDAREAAAFLEVDSRAAARILATLVRRGWLTRHMRGIFEIAPLWSTPARPFTPDRFTAIDRWLKGPYYVGFRSAFEIRDWLDYPVRGRMWIAVPTSRHTPTTVRDRVIWVVLKRDLFEWGRERLWIGSGTLWVSDAERSLLDGLHLPRHVGGVSEVVHALSRAWASIDQGRLLSHVERYGNDSATRRLGVVLDHLNLPGSTELTQRLHEALSSGRRSATLLDPLSPPSGPIDRRWGVRINIDWDLEREAT